MRLAALYASSTKTSNTVPTYNNRWMGEEGRTCPCSLVLLKDGTISLRSKITNKEDNLCINSSSEWSTAHKLFVNLNDRKDIVEIPGL